MNAAKILIIVNDPPYGTERSYNAFRLGLRLVKTEGVELRVVLLADAVFCGIQGQKTPDGYYNIASMLKGLSKAKIKACGACMDARGLAPEHLLPGIARGGMPELAEWVVSSDKVLVF